RIDTPERRVCCYLFYEQKNTVPWINAKKSPANATTGTRQIPDSIYNMLILGYIRSVFPLFTTSAFLTMTSPFSVIHTIGISILELPSTANQTLRIRMKTKSGREASVQTSWMDSSCLLSGLNCFFQTIIANGTRILSGGKQTTGNTERLTILFHFSTF